MIMDYEKKIPWLSSSFILADYTKSLIWIKDSFISLIAPKYSLYHVAVLTTLIGQGVASAIFDSTQETAAANLEMWMWKLDIIDLHRSSNRIE